MICCRICRHECRNVIGLRVHLARRHGIRGDASAMLARRAEAPRQPCPFCARDFAQGQGLSSHLAQAHGIASAHPKTRANRQASGRAVAAEPLPRLPRDVITLLEAVIVLARHDAASDADAAQWLDSLRKEIAR